MKIDLTHSIPELNAGLAYYKSPENESSILKNVPLSLLPEFKQLLREMFPGIRLYTKYRGPRQSVGTDSGTCLKENAKSAAIYCRSTQRKYDRTAGNTYREWTQYLNL
jgi:hypothetical protein